ncbi:MAG TPA: SDR family oxidoreductase [Flavisolibacter sp.]|jgi:NAD(P)-dependent dehydrogenase (short-subunit alcohol dehydrogenase family)|nr:SDR family oxidoreductase [Flavisolibacter sp.]
MYNSSFTLKGKTILVTGASSGIGFAVAQQCAQMGARLIITGRNEQSLDKLITQLPPAAHQKIVQDLAIENGIQNLVQQIEKLDGLVHCAGLVEPFPAGFLNRKKIDQTFSINFYVPVELTAMLLKHKKMNQGGSVVFISSIAATNSFIGGAAYASSKAALEAFCRTIALEYAVKHIRANCLAPAMVKTKIFDNMAKNVEKHTVEAHLAKYPLGVGQPEDVANACVFLLSNASRWITGITIRMDGGLLLGS